MKKLKTEKNQIVLVYAKGKVIKQFPDGTQSDKKEVATNA